MRYKSIIRTLLIIGALAAFAPAAAQAEAPTFTSGPGALTSSSTLSFEFSLPGALGYQCAFDGGEYGTCVSPLVRPTFGDGAHTLSVKANIIVINQQCIPDGFGGQICVPMPTSTVSDAATYAFTVDRTLPNTSVKSGPKNRSASKSRNVTFKFSSEDGSTYTCALDKKAAAACTSPYKLKKLKVGVHTLTVVATDAAGNVGKPMTRVFAVNSKTKAFKFVSSKKYKVCKVKKKRLVKCRTKKL